MGLDSYLTVRKYVSGYEFDDKASKQQFANLLKEMELSEGDIESGNPSGYVEFTVAYWRKANQIHNWFVKNVQDNEDDCEKYEVSRESLQKLVDLCKKVIKEKETAKDVLPTSDGFFFGETDYGDYYFETLKCTVCQLEKVLKNPKFNDDSGFCFEYRASW